MPQLVLISQSLLSSPPTLHPSFEAVRSLRAGVKYVLLSHEDPQLSQKIVRCKGKFDVFLTGLPRISPPKGYEWISQTSQKLGEVAKPFSGCYSPIYKAAFESWKYNFSNPKEDFSNWQIPLDPLCRPGGQDIQDKRGNKPWRAKNWINTRDLERMPLWLLNDPTRVFMERGDKTDTYLFPHEKSAGDVECPTLIASLNLKSNNTREIPSALIASEGVNYSLVNAKRKGLNKRYLTGPEILERCPSGFSWMGSVAGWPLKYCPPRFLLWWAAEGEFTGGSSSRHFILYVPSNMEKSEKEEWVREMRASLNLPHNKTRVISLPDPLPLRVESTQLEAEYKVIPATRYFPERRILVKSPAWDTPFSEFPKTPPFISELNDHMEKPYGEFGEALIRYVKSSEMRNKLYFKEEVDISKDHDPSLADTYRDLQSFRGIWTGRRVLIASISNSRERAYYSDPYHLSLIREIESAGILLHLPRVEEVYAEEYSEYGWQKSYKPISSLPPAPPILGKLPQPFTASMEIQWHEWRERGCLTPPVFHDPHYLLERRGREVTSEERTFSFQDPVYTGGDVHGKWGSFMGSPCFLEVENQYSGNIRTRSKRDKIINSLYQGDSDEPNFQTGLDEWSGRRIIRNSYPMLAPQDEPRDWAPPPPVITTSVQAVDELGYLMFKEDGSPVMVEKALSPEGCSPKQYRAGVRIVQKRLSDMNFRMKSLLERWRIQWETKLSLINNNSQEVKEFYAERDEAVDSLITEQQDLDLNLRPWIYERDSMKIKGKGLVYLRGEVKELFRETRSLLKTARKVLKNEGWKKKLKVRRESEKTVISLSLIPPDVIRDFLIRKMTEGWFVVDAVGNVSLSEWMREVIEGKKGAERDISEEQAIENYLYSDLEEEDDDDDLDEVEEEVEEDEEE